MDSFLDRLLAEQEAAGGQPAWRPETAVAGPPATRPAAVKASAVSAPPAVLPDAPLGAEAPRIAIYDTLTAPPA